MDKEALMIIINVQPQEHNDEIIHEQWYAILKAIHYSVIPTFMKEKKLHCTAHNYMKLIETKTIN